MAITTRGNKPAASDAPLWDSSGANIGEPETTLIESGYAYQDTPDSADWNWITNYLSAGVTHCFVYGIPIWDTEETYVIDSYTNRNGIIYRSRLGGNQGNVPETSPLAWHDIRQPLLFAISSDGTHNPGTYFNELLQVDTTSESIELVVSPGNYNGQTVDVEVSGGNNCSVSVGGEGTVEIFSGDRRKFIWNGTRFYVYQRNASTSVKGIVQLSNSISETSSLKAATPTAVKTVNDKVETNITDISDLADLVVFQKLLNGFVQTVVDSGVSTDVSLRAVCYGGSTRKKFVAVGETVNNSIMLSEEGSRWSIKHGFDGGLTGICWSDMEEMFVSVGIYGSNNVAYSSDQGETWTQITIPNGQLRSVCYSETHSLFVAVGSAGTNNVQYSSNGVSWNIATGSEPGALESVCVSETLGVFVAVGASVTNNVQYSFNGSTWNPITITGGISLYSVCFSEEKNRFVAVGQDQITNTKNIWYSSNGTSWLSVETEPVYLRSVFYSKTLGIFVAVGLQGYLLYSYDGTTWKRVTTKTTETEGLCFSEDLGIFVTVDNSTSENIRYF